MSEVFLHPDARCESLEVGAGTRVWAFAHILPNAVIGADCNIGDGAFIEGGAHLGDRVTVKNASLIWDGVTIGNDVFIGPRVTFTNDRTPRSCPGVSGTEWLVPTVVDDGATLGANVTVVAGVRIGSYAMVGAGAVVTHDVAPHALVVGNPARPIGWVARNGERLDAALVAPSGERYSYRDPERPSGGLQLGVATEDLVPTRSH